MPQDSRGTPVRVGSLVKFRGKEYTIKKFNIGRGLFGTSTIEFEEDQHTNEVADEICIDLVSY